MKENWDEGLELKDVEDTFLELRTHFAVRGLILRALYPRPSACNFSNCFVLLRKIL